MYIIVKWIKCDPKTGYNEEMRVIASDHYRFVVGSRFDYGFMTIAGMEGYTITVIPLDSKN